MATLVVCVVMQAALLLLLWDNIKPKFDSKAIKQPERPEMPILPEVEDIVRKISERTSRDPR